VGQYLNLYKNELKSCGDVEAVAIPTNLSLKNLQWPVFHPKLTKVQVAVDENHCQEELSINIYFLGVVKMSVLPLTTFIGSSPK